jgi:hypothetical protein
LAVAAGTWGLLRLEVACLLAAGAGLALAALLLSERRLSWAGSAGAVFVLLLLGVLHLQPAYNRQFALRGHLRRHARLPDGRRLPVVCYPQRWDSVSFYLPAAEVRSYELGQRHLLLRDLRRGPDRLLLVKVGPVLDGLLRALPPDVEFLPRGRSGPIAVGHLRGRAPVLVSRPGVSVAVRSATGHRGSSGGEYAHEARTTEGHRLGPGRGRPAGGRHLCRLAQPAAHRRRPGRLHLRLPVRRLWARLPLLHVAAAAAATASYRPVFRSTVPSVPEPDSQTHNRPPCQRGE